MENVAKASFPTSFLVGSYYRILARGVISNKAATNLYLSAKLIMAEKTKNPTPAVPQQVSSFKRYAALKQNLPGHISIYPGRQTTYIE